MTELLTKTEQDTLWESMGLIAKTNFLITAGKRVFEKSKQGQTTPPIVPLSNFISSLIDEEVKNFGVYKTEIWTAISKAHWGIQQMSYEEAL